MMFGVGTATRVYLALGATDMRKGFEGLHGLVRQRLALDPLSGHLFLFCNRSRTRLKVLFWDGSGLWVCAKRLEKGRFSWPQEGGPAVKAAINGEELSLLLGGIDLSQTRRKVWWRREPGWEQSEPTAARKEPPMASAERRR
jgi:transposase